jgi:hypothetical protein
VERRRAVRRLLFHPMRLRLPPNLDRLLVQREVLLLNLMLSDVRRRRDNTGNRAE